MRWACDLLEGVESNSDPKVEVVFGPSRFLGPEQNLAPDCGTNWGPGHPLTGKSLRDLREAQRAREPPPPYSE